MNKDEYGEVINGEETYKDIVCNLQNGNSVIIGWTDEKYTHLDLLFNYKTYKNGMLQRGLRGNELFVSIMSIGAFGFDVNDDEKRSGYIAEKLNIYGEETKEKLTELINNIIRRLTKQYKLN